MNETSSDSGNQSQADSVPKPACASPAAEHRRQSAGKSLKLAILTISDSRTLANDTSGQYLVDQFSKHGHQIADRRIVRDEIEAIRAVVAEALEAGLDALIMTGGTGVSPRDCTPEAVRPLLEVELPGFGELFRMLSYAEIGAASMLSRALAGRTGSLLVFCLPGSTNAVRLATDKLLLSDLPHLVHHSRG